LEIFSVFRNPDRYARAIPIEKLVADRKVYAKGVDRYKRMLEQGKDLGTIIVVKHPRKDLYAVLDGHHRFWAQKESGIKAVECAVITDYYGLTFHLTKHGVWQPSPEFTRRVRIPLIRWGEGFMRFLKDFREDPLGTRNRKVEKVETDEELDEDDLI
jgi:hypothetical protein